MIPDNEGSIFFAENFARQEVVLLPGTKIDRYRLIEENCKTGYHQTEYNRILMCKKTGRWEPDITNKLCLSKYYASISITVRLGTYN